MASGLTEAFYQVIDSVTDWKQAVDIACKPLNKTGCIKESFCKELIANALLTDKHGIIAPYVVLPFGKVVEGVQRNARSILLLKQPFNFDDSFAPIRLLVVIAASNAHCHLAILRSTASVLNDSQQCKAILNGTDARDLERIFGGEV